MIGYFYGRQGRESYKKREEDKLGLSSAKLGGKSGQFCLVLSGLNLVSFIKFNMALAVCYS